MTKVGRRRRDIFVAVALGVLATSLGAALSAGHLGILPARDVRKLAQAILVSSYNPWNQTSTTYSLNTVSAVVWDYRGIDTVFETAVLFAAVVGVSALFRGVREKRVKGRGMTLVAKIPTQVILLVTVVISLSIAIHGHLTPGGGFQAGAVMATAVALGIMVFSIDALYSIGLSTKLLLKVRLVALLSMLFIALIPLAISLATGTTAYIMQNQMKHDSQLSMPNMFFNTPLAGSIFFFNILEFIAVASAFSYTLILFAIHGEELKHVLKRVEEGAE